MILAIAQPNGARGLFWIIVLLTVYVLPTIVAYLRKVPNKGSVAVVDVLLGWTLIGWVAALAMAARSRPAASA